MQLLSIYDLNDIDNFLYLLIEIVFNYHLTMKQFVQIRHEYHFEYYFARLNDRMIVRRWSVKQGSLLIHY